MNSTFKRPFSFPIGRNTRTRPFTPSRGLQISCCISDIRRLGPKPLEPVLNEEVSSLLTPFRGAFTLIQGKIHSNTDATTKASVFAIFDQNKKLQYIGFSKGLESSLRTLFTRRPDKAHFYKSVNLTKLDQKEMMGIRDAWFDEVGGPPAGNKLALEKQAWQQPVDITTNTSTSSKIKAAEEKSDELLQIIKERGCIEEFIPNPELLTQGQVELVMVDTLSDEEVAAKKAEMDAINKATRFGKAVVQGEETEFSVYFKSKILTNGGTMFDVLVSHNNEDTSHRVIVGDEYYSPYDLTAEDTVMTCFAFVIEQETERHTEGLLLMTQFPINYFTVAEVDQRFPNFREHFKKWTGKELTGDKFWRFNRVADYGGKLERLEGYETPLPKYGEYQLLANPDYAS